MRIPEEFNPAEEDADEDEGSELFDTLGKKEGLKVIFGAEEDEVLVEIHCQYERALYKCKTNPNTLVWKTITHEFVTDPRVAAASAARAEEHGSEAVKTTEQLQARWLTIWSQYCKWY
eukprot:325832-Rhodomonas_salina.1